MNMIVLHLFRAPICDVIEYRVMKNFGPLSQDEIGKVLADSAITPCKISKSKWGAQKCRSKIIVWSKWPFLRETVLYGL